MYIESFGLSDIGLVRLNNEDVWAQLLEEQFYVLADGMGGHNAGEVAASEAVRDLCKKIKRYWRTSYTPTEWVKILEKSILETNRYVFNLSINNPELEGMGTTLCLALFTDQTLIYAHVGDSRIYRIRKGRITQLTRDHSLKYDLIAKGELDESKASSFPRKNVITRAIGTQKTVVADIQAKKVEKNDIYFLCSDGLTDILSDKQIQNIIEDSPTVKIATEELILEAKKKGGSDNITIVMIKIK